MSCNWPKSVVPSITWDRSFHWAGRRSLCTWLVARSWYSTVVFTPPANVYARVNHIFESSWHCCSLSQQIVRIVTLLLKIALLKHRSRYRSKIFRVSKLDLGLQCVKILSKSDHGTRLQAGLKLEPMFCATLYNGIDMAAPRQNKHPI